MQEAKKLRRKLKRAGGAVQEIKTEGGKAKRSGNKVKPVYNSEGKIVFSKFDFTEDSAALAAEKKKILDPKSALQKIKKQKENLKTLKEKGQF